MRRRRRKEGKKDGTEGRRRKEGSLKADIVVINISQSQLDPKLCILWSLNIYLTNEWVNKWKLLDCYQQILVVIAVVVLIMNTFLVYALARPCSKHFTCINSVNLRVTLGHWVPFTHPFYKQENWGMRFLSNFPKTIWLYGYRVRIQTQAV